MPNLTASIPPSTSTSGTSRARRCRSAAQATKRGRFRGKKKINHGEHSCFQLILSA